MIFTQKPKTLTFCRRRPRNPPFHSIRYLRFKYHLQDALQNFSPQSSFRLQIWQVTFFRSPYTHLTFAGNKERFCHQEIRSSSTWEDRCFCHTSRLLLRYWGESIAKLQPLTYQSCRRVLCSASLH